MRFTSSVPGLATILILFTTAFWAGHLVGPLLVSETPRFVRLESFVAPEMIRATALDAREEAVDFAEHDRPLLLLVLSTSCRFCEANVDAWMRLTASLEQLVNSPAMLMLSLSSSDETERFLAEHGMSIAARLVDSSAIGALELPGVPATVVVDPVTRSAYRWVGLLDADAEAEIIRRIGGSEAYDSLPRPRSTLDSPNQ